MFDVVKKSRLLKGDEDGIALKISQLHKLFFKLRDRFGQTFVIVTHNHELAW